MAETRRYGFNTQLDIEQILLEAQNRWLRPAEICEILRNYRKFRIAPEPPNRPSSGSLFLFDRKVLRYFRKDGHNWRKKKDGKTVKEAHERLKAGSVDVLHCYYAHGEESESFQRRSYWMLEEDFTHIVLVHYREVQGNRTSFGRPRDTEEILPFHPNHNQLSSQTMDTSSLASAQTSEYEDPESDNHQASSRYHSFLELPQSVGGATMNNMDVGILNNYLPVPCSSNQCDDYQGNQSTIPGIDFASLNQGNTSRGIDDTGYALSFSETRKQDDLVPWEDVFEHCTMGYPNTPFTPSTSAQPDNIVGLPKQESVIIGQHFTDGISIKQEVVRSPRGQSEWQIASEEESSDASSWPLDQKLHIGYDLGNRFQQQKGHYENLHNALENLTTDSDQQNGRIMQNEFRMQHSNAEVGFPLTSNLDLENDLTMEGNVRSSSITKQLLLDCSRTEGEEGLKKFDSFSRWMSKELGEVESHMQSSSGVFWNSVDSENVVEDSSMSHQVHLDAYLLSPSLSQDQLFSIFDFSPNWTYTGLETKVLITGIFLKNKEDADKRKWSCMFGEVEVPAEVLADGVLRCVAPLHTAGRVPFYVTCSNRLACSEVREFEYRVIQTQFAETLGSFSGNTSDMRLHIRLGKLLSLESVGHSNPIPSSAVEKHHISSKISSLLKENDDEWFQMEKLTTDKDFSPDKIKEKLLQKLLKEQLHAWLLHKVAEDGKGPSVLDKQGQGVLHLAAALGYDWAIAPTLAAGVNINFRDVHGWTALHWAAFSGRESTVVVLVSLGADPGALTDPTPKSPSGRTPADLASGNGHKGIAGYLAEYSLTNHLSTLTLKEASGYDDVGEGSSVKAVQTIAERSATQPSNGDLQDGLSLKDSLTAVRNAAQAAARIHQVFRVHSFHRKQLIEYGDGNFGSSAERALSLISIKTQRTGQHEEPVHMAAIRIQNKFRGWKGRKEFLIIRQRIVKIQAHVRGHQMRKHYKNIIWSVGIVEKVILRWRRRGSGLRGFRPEGLIEGSTIQNGPSKDDEYDFLQEGRKQTEARLEKALARVKSMVQYPEARDQYRRLVTDFQKTKVGYERLLGETEEAVDGDDLIDIEALLEEDDAFMSTTC